jgi:hypothetical protein
MSKAMIRALVAGGSAAAMLVAIISCQELQDFECSTFDYFVGNCDEQAAGNEETGDNGGDVPDGNVAPPGPADVDHVAAFKQHIMIDTTREPDWFGEVTHVRLTNGTLFAETTLPPGFRDTSRRSRPAESICGRLYAYAKRGAKLTWTSITVKASDGSTLVTRQGEDGSCKQT